MSWYLSIAVSFLPLVWLVPLSPRCKYILQCVCLEYLVAQSHPTLCDPMDCILPGSSIHGDYPGKNTGVGCHAVLQETETQSTRHLKAATRERVKELRQSKNSATVPSPGWAQGHSESSFCFEKQRQKQKDNFI